MGDENPIRTLGDYSKPSHEGYRNTIELPYGTTWYLFDPTPSVNSLDLDGENRERTRLRLFQFSLHGQASNWLERLLVGSITTWEDFTTRFLAQFFPPGRTAKLCNDILMFQQHHGESLSEAWTRFKDLLQKCEIDHAAGGNLRNKNADESWEIIENLTLYDHEGWNDTKVFAKPVKAISTPQGTSKTPEQRLLELEDQINFLLKGEEKEKHDIYDIATGNDSKETDGPDIKVSVKEVEIKNRAKSGTKNEPIKKPKKEEVMKTPSSRPVEYYLKHRINEKLIEGIVDDNSIGGLKHMNTLVDQGSDVNVMPHFTYMKLTDEWPAETEIRLSLASHLYIYPLGIAEHGMAKIAVGEGITRSVFGVKGVDLGARTPYYARKDFSDYHLPGEWEIARDAELNPFKDTLMFRRMVGFVGSIPINLKSNMWESEDLIKNLINWDKPHKNGDEAWHIKIRLIDPKAVEFTNPTVNPHH
ncbi:MAK10-like protein [Tanacetum coccineum]